MCLYPKLIENKKYKANKKNGGKPPLILDERTRWVPVACGKCMECCKKKAREWQIRMLEEIRQNNNGKFITLTFSNKAIKVINEKIDQEEKELQIDYKTEGYDRDNRIATYAVRHWLERWRKKYKKSIRHWLITELGHKGTKNIHLHGIVWTDEPIQAVTKTWQSGEDGGGYVWEGKKVIRRNNGTQREEIENYVNEATVNYITKYVTKVDSEHKYYQPKILCSKGIGGEYHKTFNARLNKYKEEGTREYYITRTGHKILMPVYWRNKLYTEEEREKLWIEKLDKQERWVGGEKVDISKGEVVYYKLLKYYQKINIELGYNSDKENWEQKEYENQRRNLLRKERIKKQWIKEKIINKSANAL